MARLTPRRAMLATRTTRDASYCGLEARKASNCGSMASKDASDVASKRRRANETEEWNAAPSGANCGLPGASSTCTATSKLLTRSLIVPKPTVTERPLGNLVASTWLSRKVLPAPPAPRSSTRSVTSAFVLSSPAPACISPMRACSRSRAIRSRISCSSASVRALGEIFFRRATNSARSSLPSPSPSNSRNISCASASVEWSPSSAASDLNSNGSMPPPWSVSKMSKTRR
mmetsp:Transcript_10185/g.30189  ORF Transcript_10185/g.30189 Transcript_10185/m.30189 type:complete len:230 (-) Transcript_10185:163-852(-)